MTSLLLTIFLGCIYPTLQTPDPSWLCSFRGVGNPKDLSHECPSNTNQSRNSIHCFYFRRMLNFPWCNSSLAC